ncbi:MAG: flagellar motor protein MotB [Clostridiales bacterium]
MDKIIKNAKKIRSFFKITYTDIVSLLLVVFIILFSLSKISNDKVFNISNSIDNLFISEESSKTNTKLETNKPNSKINNDEFNSISNEINKIIKNSNLKSSISLIKEERGLNISISSNFLFNPENNLKYESKCLIENIGKVIKPLKNNYIRVESHTDNQPINTTTYKSNWELSVLRACSVLKYLVDQVGINPKKISSTGYGEYRPKVANNSEKNMIKNRRVNIIILNSENSDLEPKGISKK